MQDVPRFVRGLPSRVKTMGLRASVSTALTLGAAAFTQFHPADIARVQPPLTVSSVFGSGADLDLSKVFQQAQLPAPPQHLAVEAEVEAAPLPKARPKPVAAAAAAPGAVKQAAAALPQGVERFDRCRTACDTRDPVILAGWTPPTPAATANTPPAPPAHAAAVTPPLPILPLSTAGEPVHSVSLEGAMSLIGSGKHVLDGGKHMIDGALSTAGATIDTVKSAMLGVITPGR